MFDKNGNQMVPPNGVALAYVCSTIQGGTIGCSVLSEAGPTLSRGAAIYVLQPSEYMEPGS